jgi:hypothetical protein
MTNPSTSNRTKPSDNRRRESVEERIRRRADELYEQRGRQEGHDIEDWLQAEAEITLQRSRKASA